MAGTYSADEHDEEDGTERVLGTVTLDGRGLLGIVSQVADEDERLETIVGELNAEDVLHVEAAPPAGAREFEVFTAIVKRGTDGFVPALLEHLRRYHDIELRPA